MKKKTLVQEQFFFWNGWCGVNGAQIQQSQMLHAMYDESKTKISQYSYERLKFVPKKKNINISNEKRNTRKSKQKFFF